MEFHSYYFHLAFSLFYCGAFFVRTFISISDNSFYLGFIDFGNFLYNNRVNNLSISERVVESQKSSASSLLASFPGLLHILFYFVVHYYGRTWLLIVFNELIFLCITLLSINIFFHIFVEFPCNLNMKLILSIQINWIT